MATWYIDYENGTDSAASSGNGDSYATRRKKLDNLGTTPAAGDAVRIMASPDPVSLGINGTWTNGPIGTAVNVTSSTNATPIVVTLTSGNYSTLSPAVNDTVILTGHTTNTNANGVWTISAVNSGSFTVTLVNADGSNSSGNGVGGATGTVRKYTPAVITLASAVTKNIALCGNRGTKTNWTASTNITNTITTAAGKEGDEYFQCAVGASFTTGKAAYYTLPSSTDFSGYQQISFWFMQSAGTVTAASDITIKLCSDTTGDTAVDSFNLPASGVLNVWEPLVINKGSALGNAIQSIALYINTDSGAQTFRFDNIIACKDPTANDSLTLNSLIGKSGSDSTWWAIQSINGTRVVIDNVNSVTPQSAPSGGYFGTTETVTTYKREPILSQLLTSGVMMSSLKAGTSGSPITISGGWNRTDMSTQTGQTYYSGVSGQSSAISLNSYNNLSGVNFVRFGAGITFANAGVSVNTITCDNVISCGNGINFVGFFANYTCTNTLNSNVALSGGGGGHVVNITNIYGVSTVGNGALNMNTIRSSVFTVVNIYGNNYTNGYGVVCGSATRHDNKIYVTNIKYCAYGVYFSSGASANVSFYNITFSNNVTSSIGTAASSVGSSPHYFYNCVFNDATEMTQVTAAGAPLIYSHNHNATSGNHKQWLRFSVVTTDTSVRHTASGNSWKISVIDATNCTSTTPEQFSVARVAMRANAQATIKLWMRRTNTGLTARLMCKGGQIAGVSADVSTNMSAAADTWEEVQIQITPTETGVVEITAECWGGSTYSLYVDDFSATQ